MRDLTNTAGGDYFSDDGGNTNLKAFNSVVANGDLTDWDNGKDINNVYVPDSYNAQSSYGYANTLSVVDGTVMDVLGYNRSSTNLTFKTGSLDFLAGQNWSSSSSSSLDPFHGASMVINNSESTAYHYFTPGENFTLASNSDMGQSMTVSAGFLELSDSGQVTGSGFGLLVNQDGSLFVSGTGQVYAQGPVSIGDAAGVTNGLAEISGGDVIVGNSAESETLYVGNAGHGELVQSGTSYVSTPSLVVGNQRGSSGLYFLEGTATLSVVGDEVVGYAGSADFEQEGGLNTITGSLILAQNYGYGTGTYELMGGTLDAATVELDNTDFNLGPTTFTQSGGTLNTSTVFVNGSSTFNLTSEGICNASISNEGNVNFSGGLFGGDFNNTESGTFTYTAGLFGGSFTNDGVMNVNASLNIPGGMLNQAPVSLTSGITLSVNGTGLDNQSTINLPTGSVLTLNGSGLDNESTINISGGTINGSGTKTNNDIIEGTGTISGTGALMNDGTIAESFGPIVLGLNGNPYYNNDSITLEPTFGELDISTPNSPTTDRLINYGSIAINGAVIDGSGGLENASGGTVGGTGKINTADFVNDSGGTVSVPAGTLNVVPVLNNSGTIDLTDPAAILAGTHGVANSGTIEGIGTVSAGISNTGTIQPGDGTLTLSGSVLTLGGSNLVVDTGGTLLVVGAGHGLQNIGGTITLAGGTLDNDGQPVTNAGLITGYGIFNSGGLTNGIAITHAGSMTLSGGPSTINGNVTNVRTISVTNGSAEFTGNVGGAGTFVANSAYVVFDGTYTGTSYSSTDSNNSFENNVTIPSGGSMTGSSDSNFYVSGGTTVTNGGTFTNTGLLANYVPTTNNGTFSQTGSLVQGADFTNNATATIGGSQDWLPGTNFNNTAGTATFQTDAGSSGSGTLNVNITGGVVTIASAQDWAGLSITGSGKLDIANNQVFIYYGDGPDPIASIEQWIANGYYGLSGPSIISSVIAADDALSGLSYGIGYADGADGLVAGLPSGEIEIMFTLLGDANLDGTVNAEDFTPFSQNLGQGGTMWDDGDFNYDGTVNSEDFTPFSANIGQTASLAAQAGVLEGNSFSVANVPEPMSAGMMVVFGSGILRRRRKRS